jgi:hypothetical protein
MIIGIRKQIRHHIDSAEEVVEIWKDACNHKIPRERLELPPYNYTFIEVPDEYVETMVAEDFNDDFTFNLEKYNKRLYDNESNELRNQRDFVCFQVINRGEPYYRRLTESQKQELDTWYQNWLDVTKTRIIPTPPTWLDVPEYNTLNSFEMF